MNSLLIEKAINQEDKMRKEGMKRQCNTQIADKEIASLSVKSCVFINFPKSCSLKKKHCCYNFFYFVNANSNLLNQTAVDEYCNQQSGFGAMIYPSMIGPSLYNDIMGLQLNFFFIKNQTYIAF